MTTEKLYTKSAADLLAWLDENPTQPLTIERKWVEAHLASKLEIIAELASDEDAAAYQVGYDDGYVSGTLDAKEDVASEMEDLESKIEDLEAEISDLEEQAANAFAEGFETASKDMS